MSSPMNPLANWAGNITFGATRTHRPETVEQLRRLVAGSKRIRAVGTAHSFNAVADTTGDLVRLDGLPATVNIDTTNCTAIVAAGLRYADVALALHRRGFALSNLASLPHISVAGSCATGTHGSGDANRCLAASVRALRLVGPDGDIIELSRDTDENVFPGAVVALGALGIVTDLTLDIVPEFEMAQRVRVDVPLDAVAGRLDEVFGAGYSVSVFTDWLSGLAHVWVKYRADQRERDWDGGSPAVRPMNPVSSMPPDFSTEQLGVPGPSYQRLPHFRPELPPSAGDELQSEYYLPRTAAPAAIAAIRDLAELVEPVLHIAELRTVQADDLWLSPAYGRDTITFHFTWIRDMAAVSPVIAAVEDRLLPLAARPHWGKLTALSGPELIARFERGTEFERLTHNYDPDGKFRNAFTDSLFPAGRS